MHGVDSPASAVRHLIVCLHVIFFSYLTINHPWLYKALTTEDSWVENATAGLFLLTGLLLFATAWAEKGFPQRCLHILGGLVMVLVAGEEISWGQRLIGFATPDALMDINARKSSIFTTSTPIYSTSCSFTDLWACALQRAPLLRQEDRTVQDSPAVHLDSVGFPRAVVMDVGSENR